MIVHLSKWMERFKFIFLFLLLTYIMTHVYGYLTVWIDAKDPYHEPRGQAVKVSGDAVSSEESVSMGDRLKFFYRYGE